MFYSLRAFSTIPSWLQYEAPIAFPWIRRCKKKLII